MAERISTIMRFLERDLGPLSRQYDWDNSGKQVFPGDIDVNRVCLALDPSEHAVNTAIEKGCELLVTHHPLFFRPVRALDAADPVTSRAMHALKNNLAILSYHTSLDLADGGLNDHLVHLIGGTNRGFLRKEGADGLSKFVVFVPKGHEQGVIDAMGNEGAGHIGNYSHCTFRTAGTGTFKPGEGSDPFIGTVGDIEEVEEYRVESIVPNSRLDAVKRAVIEAHPYEEVAHDIFPTSLEEPWGIGRVADLDAPIPLVDFLAHLKTALNVPSLAINTDAPDDVAVSRYAVVSGSGAGFWKACLRAGVDVLVTGDMKHHDALDARQAGITVIDAGHFATEQVYMHYLAETLAERFGVETIVCRENPAIHHWG